MNQDLAHVGGTEDLRKKKVPKKVQIDPELDEEAQQEEEKVAEPAKGILKTGADAKFSQGKSQADKEMEKEQEQLLEKAEEARVVEATLIAYLKAMSQQAAAGFVVKTVRSLEMALRDKHRVYSNQPKNPSIWRVAKALADIALKHAVKSLNNRQLDTAYQYMKMVQKHTEPIAGSDWSLKPEWILLRKNLHKNFALYHQKNVMWQQAFDNLKLALRLENQLGLRQEATNTCLTCAILQQKMKNYGASIDYAQQTQKSIEQDLNLTKGQPLSEVRYQGRELDRQRYNDKMMTQFAIAHHIIGKNLLHLDFVKESKHFITKAHYIVTKMLVLEKKADLQLAIQMDMKTVLEKTRYLTEMEALEAKAAAAKNGEASSKKTKLAKEHVLTDADIERSLSAIKSGLATADGPDAVQDKYMEIEGEIKQLEDKGELDYAQFQEEFKEIFEDQDGNQLLDRDEQLEDRIREVKRSIEAYADPDDLEAAEQPKGAVKKQQVQRQDNQADKRETDPEYMLRLEDYKRAQEQLRLKQEGFAQRQKEFAERKLKRQQTKDEKMKALEKAATPFLKKSKDGAAALEQLSQVKVMEAKQSQAKLAQTTSKFNKLQRYQSQQRTKNAPLNLARIGAQYDVPGVLHVAQKGANKFFIQRKKNILSLNRAQYQSTEQDKVELGAGEYQQMLDEENDADGVLTIDEREGALALERQGIVGGRDKAGQRLQVYKADAGERAEAMEEYNKRVAKIQQNERLGLNVGKKAPPPSKSKRASSLFKPGMKSTQMVLDTVQERVYKPPRPGSMMTAQDNQKAQKALEEKSAAKLEALDQRQKRLRRLQSGDHEDSSEERKRREYEGLNNGRATKWQISEEGQETLARDDRNYLERQKPYEQLKKEDPDNRPVWSHDENGNKMLMRDAEGNIVDTFAAPEEEEEDPMFEGLRNLIKGTKEQAEQERIAKGETAAKLLETDKEHKARLVREKAEKEEADAVEERRKFEEAGALELKRAERGKSPPRKKGKGVKFMVSLDDKGVERGKGFRASQRLAGPKSRGRQAGQKGQAEVDPARKSRRLRAEAVQEAIEGQEGQEKKQANATHSAQTYYDKEKEKREAARTSKPRGVTGIKDPEAKDLYSLGVTGFSKDRLESLSKPINKDLHKIMKEYQDKMEPEKHSGADKAARIMQKLDKAGKVDFEDYVDRDVPPISGVTGEFSKTTKTSKGLAGFETQHQDPNGLFDNLVKEGPGETFAAKNAKEKLAKSAIAGLGGKNLRATDTHLPAYMKAARQAQLERAGGNNKARTKAFRKAMNDNTVQQMGLKSHIPFGAPQYLNLRELRDLEYTSARQIQNLARGYFTKKWYLNYIVRKKLGVPFSGIEFAQNPFLRQFNKPNTNLNRLQQVDTSNMLTAIPNAADMQLSTIQIKRLRNRQQENTLRIRGRTKMPDNTDESRLIAHKMKKGTSSQAIIERLQEDFLAHGLDAYDHFKRLQVGIDHDEEGEPQKRVIEEGKEIIEPLEDQETRDAKKQIYGVFKLPNWVGDRTDINAGGQRGGIIDTSESEQYILRKENEKFKKRGQGGGDGPTLAALLNHVVVNEPVPHKQGINPEGGGPEGGGGPGGGGEYSIQQALKAARDPDGEADFFQPSRYQEFSREPIVFYKRVVNDQKMLRWTIKAGEAFKREVGIHTASKEIKYFIPIWLVGQVLGSHQVVYYRMNLELIKISDGIATHLENFRFETIWPFILYLFNYWVKNQASLMIKSQTHPQRQIYYNELQKINKNQNYIEFFNENEQFANELEKLQQLDNLQLMMPDDEGGGEPQQNLQKGGDGFYIKSELNNFLDFSSEIHYDDRFDERAFQEVHKTVGMATEGQHRIDRSKPEGERQNTKEQRNANRQKLFEEYRRSVEEYEKTKKKVQFTQEALDAQHDADPEAAAREKAMEEEINKLVEAEKFMINIADFVKEHYLYLPNNKQDSMYRLLKALAQKAPAYAEVEKRDGINKHSLTMLNEERRRRLKLAPLTPIDYNCMERAAQKIKLIVDCLMLSRRQSGQALVAKDMIVAQMLKQQQARHLRHQKTGKKLSRIHHKIYQHWGMHVQVEPQFNAQSAQVVQSMQKIRQYQQSKHIEFKDGPADGLTATIQQELDIEDQHKQALQEEVFDQDMAELDGVLGGPGGGPVAADPQSQGDTAAARHQRIVNEYENYIEDQSIIDQQVIRLPEEVSNKEVKLFMSTISVRKIKSNIENILQILWEREAEVKRKAALANLIFTADQPDDQPIFGNFNEEPSAFSEGQPISIQVRPDGRGGGDQNAQTLMDQAPKIVRLQSKVCRIISDHEDVRSFDAQHYPPGTDKVPKLIALDVEQEKLQKPHTNYKSYAEFQVCTAINRQDMWDDSVNVQWEVLVEFFAMFGLTWDPISTMKRGRFRKEESFLINQFFCRCLFLDHNNCQALSFDMQRLDFGRIKYDEIFLWLPDNVPKKALDVDSLLEGPEGEKANQVSNVYTRQLFEKYIQNEEFITRFDESEYDKLIFPFFDESDMTFERLFKFDRKVEYMDWIVKFQDPEEQKEIGKVQRKLYPKGMGTTTPIYMVEELAMQNIKTDAQHMFNLSLSKFNQRQDDLLWLGKLQLAAVIKYSKIEPCVAQQKQNYNVKIEYFLRGMIPRIQIKAFDTYAQEVLQCNTINKKHIKMIIRVCNQQSDKMIRNQLESMIQIRATKLTVGRTLFLNFGRKQLQTKNLGQNFINMLVCHEALLQRFITNQNAAKNYLYNSGIKQFKGLIRNLTTGGGADAGDDGGSGLGSGTYLVNITQYDMFVETLLYYDPMLMIHGNKHLAALQIKDGVLNPLQRNHQAAKSFDRVKIWKINLLEMSTGLAYNVLLSLHDIVQFYESELPLVIDLDNEVGLPNLLELLRDYLSMMKTHRSLLGRIVLWKLPQYKRPTDPKTGRMINLNPDELYRMKILEIYKRMLSNIQEQLAFQDNNALPLSLDSKKAHPDQNKQKLPNLCLRSKTIREKNMPIFENNSKQLLKVFSQDMQVIVQRPKVFRESLKRLQFVLISVILHPSMECWIWQLYFPRNQRTFSVTLYSSDLFALDDEILNDEYILQAENMNQALWAHLINICQLVRNPIGDIMIQIQNFKEPLKEILFQDIVYNQNAKDMMFMEVVLKNYSNYVTDVESPFPAIAIQTEEVKRYTFAVRAFSLTRNIWIKDFQPFFEVIGMLKRENYYVNNLEYFYYTMLRDTACLLSHKIIFSEAAKTQEVKKRKLVYDIKSIIGRRAIFREVSNSIEKTGSPKKDAQIGQYLDDANRAVLEQEEHEQTELTRMNKIKNRPDWENVVLLNRIIYQAIISQNPVQMCTIIYNEVKDVFVYRLYRAVDSSIFERQITSSDVIRTCAPHLRAMLNQGLQQEVGQRVAQHYMANILVASVLEFYKIR